MSSQEDLDAWEGMGPREAMEAQQDLYVQEEADIQAALELSRIDMEERADPDEVDALPTYSSAPGPEDILLRHLLDSAAGDAPQTSGHDNDNSLPPVSLPIPPCPSSENAHSRPGATANAPISLMRTSRSTTTLPHATDL